MYLSASLTNFTIVSGFSYSTLQWKRKVNTWNEQNQSIKKIILSWNFYILEVLLILFSQFPHGFPSFPKITEKQWIGKGTLYWNLHVK